MQCGIAPSYIKSSGHKEDTSPRKKLTNPNSQIFSARQYQNILYRIVSYRTTRTDDGGVDSYRRRVDSRELVDGADVERVGQVVAE